MKPGTIVFKGQTKKGREIVVRYPLGSDVSALRNYINILSREKTFIRFQGEQVSLADEKKYLASYLKKIKKNEAVKLMVFHQNRLVAVADINLEDKISGHVGVFGITVAKDFRREGVGKLLMKLVLKEAKQIKKLKIITLGVFANNSIALRMYQKRFGLKEYGRLPQGIKHRGKFIDHIFLYKRV
ncbi:MAG: GNAT family N-acetyltransferase [Candidatus Nealsonbacteria bacterium]|nr:GNAT family N-acetyltransferase [Candidatus Nealsonbacteria bacterium]